MCIGSNASILVWYWKKWIKQKYSYYVLDINIVTIPVLVLAFHHFANGAVGLPI